MSLRSAPLLLALVAACASLAPARTPQGPGPHGAAATKQPAERSFGDTPPPIAREFRGAWVATVVNIDFPSKPGLPAAALRAELDAIVARAVELELNALVFQVRAAGDAFYKSPLEPWSEWLTGVQGKAPDGDFDPLAYVIARCHEHGLLLHAWFNPYRAAHSKGTSPPSEGHVRRRAPQLVVKYGQYEWMDPGEPLAAKWSLAVIQDVVQRYDVDGVHVDDYFYPYPEGKLTFPDDGSYQRYRDGGGKLARSDWRRANIDDFVQRMYGIVRAAKPHVAVGISPFGIARPGVPKGIQAGIDQYEQLGADVVKWLQQGWLDYLSPQLYWTIDDKPQSFPVLLAYWHEVNTKRRGMWPGINPGRALSGKWDGARPDELAEQVALLRAADRAPGHVHFSFKALRTDAKHVGGALKDRVYREPALAPAMAWLGDTAPAAPQAQLENGGKHVVCTPPPDVRFVAVQVRDGKGWRTLAITGTARPRIALPAATQSVSVTAVSRTGVTGPATVLTVR